jgi:thioester reductase-like protein
MIWNFPEGLMPITTSNIITTVEAARRQSSAPVKYFSSVPYVIQLLAEQDDGIELLKSMDLVGVGGASLPHAVGDALVDKGVNLLSRYGTAECGFLMSSHRDYASDKEWLSLRADGGLGLLGFEPRENGCFELVLTPEWPFLAKSNRQDGSYATSDLFSPHPEFSNRWYFEGRSDSQITLLNGKKFDPAAIEESILESLGCLQDVLVVGDSCDSAGALLFPKNLDSSLEDLLDELWPDIEKLNGKFPNHARLSRQMCAVVDTQNRTTALPKSSKGTTQRKQAHQQYEKQIKRLYRPDSGSYNNQKVKDCELSDAVMACFRNVLGHSIMPDKDIFRQGVDSIASSQIRKQIISTCLADTDQSIPMNILFEMATVNNLEQFLRDARGELKASGVEMQSKELEAMHAFASDLGDFSALSVGNREEERRPSTVVLTGATGFLGSFLLDMLRQDPSVKRVYCLVRADTFPEAHERVSLALSSRSMPGLDSFAASSHRDDRVVCVPCSLSEESLGLSEEMQQRIRKEATLFIHSAWIVSFNLGVSSFQDHLVGTRNIIFLAMKASAHFVFISSTAAVMNTHSDEVSEKLSLDADDSSKLGYARSKWVAEQICGKARTEYLEKSRADMSTRAGEPISIVRVGQLCGAASGVWNSSEAYPVMLSSASRTGCLPELPGVHLDWIPVDSAGRAVLEIAKSGEKQTHHVDEPLSNDDVSGTPVYHVVNSLKNPRWRDMLEYILTKYESPPFKVVSNAEWLNTLEERVDQSQATNAEEQLIGFWQETLQGSKAAHGGCSQARSVPGFATNKTRIVSPTMNELTPLDLEMARRYWEWVQR